MINRDPKISDRDRTLGSGFIVDASGLIITASDIVEDALRVDIKLENGEELSNAEVIGIDAKTQIALIEVQSKEQLQPVTFGDASKLRQGDWVVSITNPFGFGSSASIGSVDGKSSLQDMILTTVFLPDGSAGAPLFDLDGRVVGMSVARMSDEASGTSVALASNAIPSVISSLRSSGSVRRSWLGVSVSEIPVEFAQRWDLAGQQGLFISSVTPNGPADRGGLKPEDVVLAINGQAVNSPRTLADVASLLAPNTTVELKIFREGLTGNRLVVVEPLPTASEAQPGTNDSSGSVAFEGVALSVRDLTPALMAKHCLDSSIESGVLVSALRSNDPAFEQSVKIGDVITEVQREPVDTVADLNNEILNARKSGDRTVLLRIAFDGDQLKSIAFNFARAGVYEETADPTTPDSSKSVPE